MPSAAIPMVHSSSANRSILRCAVILVALLVSQCSQAQEPSSPETPEQQMKHLAQAIATAQAQMEAQQQQLLELKKQLSTLQQQLAVENHPPTTARQQTAAAEADQQRERQAMQESQIATLDQDKVESASKYPVKLSGLILMTAFTNTHAVDVPSAPTVAWGGNGSTGASLRQSVFGIDARGPHLAGAVSRADVRVDFFGGASQGGYADAGGVIRLRTMHALLDWKNTETFVEVDRPIISPNAPTSLTAIAEPALAWSGNLWNWSPQIGISHSLALQKASRLRFEAALIDVPDPPVAATSASSNVNQGEQSRWPGSEARIALLGKQDGIGPELGFGGYFSPHRTPGDNRYDAWAGTMDYRLPLPKEFELSGSLYRGQALGGLGGGGYKDYVYRTDRTVQPVRALDDVGGWTQLKKHLGERLELNAALGLDNVFASELRPYTNATSSIYQDLARNRTFFGNVIYSPSTYLLFSLEYRHISTAPAFGLPVDSNIIGIAAGYKF